MKLNKFVIATFLAILVSGLSICPVSANTLHFDGSSHLLGDVVISTNYLVNGTQMSKQMLNTWTGRGHNDWNIQIPNEAKYNDIVISQGFRGLIRGVTGVVMNYDGEDVWVSVSVINRYSTSDIELTYKNKTVRGAPTIYWS